MVRVLIGILFVASSYVGIAQEQEIAWLTIEEAQQKMEEEPRKVFIDIVADWCKWCKVMEKETFSVEEVQAYISENYYAVRLDYEDTDKVVFQGKSWIPKELAKSWGVQDLPTIVFWSEGFSAKTLNRGFQDKEKFLKSLQFFAEF